MLLPFFQQIASILSNTRLHSIRVSRENNKRARISLVSKETVGPCQLREHE